MQLWGAELWNATVDPHRVGLEALAPAGAEVALLMDRFHRRRWESLTERQQEYVAALSRRGGSARTAALADDLGRTTRDVGYLREALIQSGVVYAPRRGDIALTVPPMAEWVLGEAG